MFFCPIALKNPRFLASFDGNLIIRFKIITTLLIPSAHVPSRLSHDAIVRLPPLDGQVLVKQASTGYRSYVLSMPVSIPVSVLQRVTQRLCVKASGLGLCQAPQHETDHSDENPGFFTAGEHFIVFGEPSPCRKPGESALDNPSMWKHMKAAGTDLLPIDDGILWSPDAS